MIKNANDEDEYIDAYDYLIKEIGKLLVNSEVSSYKKKERIWEYIKIKMYKYFDIYSVKNLIQDCEFKQIIYSDDYFVNQFIKKYENDLFKRISSYASICEILDDLGNYSYQNSAKDNYNIYINAIKICIFTKNKSDRLVEILTYNKSEININDLLRIIKICYHQGTLEYLEYFKSIIANSDIHNHLSKIFKYINDSKLQNNYEGHKLFTYLANYNDKCQIYLNRFMYQYHKHTFIQEESSTIIEQFDVFNTHLTYIDKHDYIGEIV